MFRRAKALGSGSVGVYTPYPRLLALTPTLADPKAFALRNTSYPRLFAPRSLLTQLTLDHYPPYPRFFTFLFALARSANVAAGYLGDAHGQAVAEALVLSLRRRTPESGLSPGPRGAVIRAEPRYIWGAG